MLRQRRHRVVERAQAARVADRLHVVDHEDDRALVRGKPDRERLDRRQDHAGGVAQLRERVAAGARRTARPPWPETTTAGSASSSRASARTHAAACPRSASHNSTATVFPKPAGATTSVNDASQPPSSARLRRGRATIPRRSRGGASLRGGSMPAKAATEPATAPHSERVNGEAVHRDPIRTLRRSAEEPDPRWHRASHPLGRKSPKAQRQPSRLGLRSRLRESSPGTWCTGMRMRVERRWLSGRGCSVRGRSGTGALGERRSGRPVLARWAASPC